MSDTVLCCWRSATLQDTVRVLATLHTCLLRYHVAALLLLLLLQLQAAAADHHLGQHEVWQLFWLPTKHPVLREVREGARYAGLLPAHAEGFGRGFSF